MQNVIVALAYRSREYLKKRYPELKLLIPDLRPIEDLSDEQVFEMLRKVGLLDLLLKDIKELSVMGCYTINAHENPIQYLYLLFPLST